MLVFVRRNELEVNYTKTSRVFAKCTDSVLLGPGRGFYLLFVTSWLSGKGELFTHTIHKLIFCADCIKVMLASRDLYVSKTLSLPSRNFHFNRGSKVQYLTPITCLLCGWH